jgi:hypothetical protein
MKENKQPNKGKLFSFSLSLSLAGWLTGKAVEKFSQHFNQN